MTEPHVVTQARIPFGLRTFGAAPSPLAGDLEYTSADPYAVAVVLHAGTGPVRWTFGRDLLADGLLAAAGEGDVVITPAADQALVVIVLSSPDGAAVLEAPAHELAAFLDRTYQAVPAGQESAWIDFDDELAKLVVRD